MNISRDDRNVLFMLVVVLVISAITLYALFTIFLGLISPTVTTISSLFGFTVQSYTGTYLVEVPDITMVEETEIITPEPIVDLEDNPNKVAVLDFDYILSIPDVNSEQNDGNLQISDADLSLAGIKDSLLSDIEVVNSANSITPTQSDLSIKIGKITVDSPIFQGTNGEELLDLGFWAHPASNQIGEGEVTLLCHRRFFGPTDPKSCWFLNRLEIGDQIDLYNSNTEIQYRVIGINIFKEGDSLIYQMSKEKDYLKIVTCTPLGKDTHRLVILAEMIDI